MKKNTETIRLKAPQEMKARLKALRRRWGERSVSDVVRILLKRGLNDEAAEEVQG